jgi:hypothetical protein
VVLLPKRNLSFGLTLVIRFDVRDSAAEIVSAPESGKAVCYERKVE